MPTQNPGKRKLRREVTAANDNLELRFSVRFGLYDEQQESFHFSLSFPLMICQSKAWWIGCLGKCECKWSWSGEIVEAWSPESFQRAEFASSFSVAESKLGQKGFYDASIRSGKRWFLCGKWDSYLSFNVASGEYNSIEGFRKLWAFQVKALKLNLKLQSST